MNRCWLLNGGSLLGRRLLYIRLRLSILGRLNSGWCHVCYSSHCIWGSRGSFRRLSLSWCRFCRFFLSWGICSSFGGFHFSLGGISRFSSLIWIRACYRLHRLDCSWDWLWLDDCSLFLRLCLILLLLFLYFRSSLVIIFRRFWISGSFLVFLVTI